MKGKAEKNKINFFKTYLSVIKNSVGSRAFRNFYLRLGGKDIDVAKSGKFSCAFFVSNVLNMFPVLGLIKEPHLRVESAVADMKKSGWEEIAEIRPGAVLLWEKKLSNGTKNKHLGFYIGNNRAISNSMKKGCPIVHHWTYGEKNGWPVRQVEAIFWHPSFEK